MAAGLMYLVGPLAGVAAWALLMRYVRPGEPVHDYMRALRLGIARLERQIGAALLPAVRRAAEAFAELGRAFAQLNEGLDV